MNYGNNPNVGYGYVQGGMNFSTYNQSGMGGFSNDSTADFFGSTTGDSSGGVKKPKNLSIRHVTLKQIKDIHIPEDKDAPLMMDGLEVSQVVIVGAISSPPDAQAASSTLSVEDGTGFIDVRFWGSSSSGEVSLVARQLEAIKPRTYIQIIGNLRLFNAKVGVAGIHVRPIENPNEIIAHFLECIHTHLSLAGPKKPTSNAGFGQLPSFLHPNFVTAGAHDQSNGDPAFHLRRTILQYIFVTGNGNSISKAQIKKVYENGAVTQAEVDHALQWLIEEGHVYSPDGSETFKANSGSF